MADYLNVCVISQITLIYYLQQAWFCTLCPPFSSLLQEHYKIFSFSKIIRVYGNLPVYENEPGYCITFICNN